LHSCCVEFLLPSSPPLTSTRLISPPHPASARSFQVPRPSFSVSVTFLAPVRIAPLTFLFSVEFFPNPRVPCFCHFTYQFGATVRVARIARAQNSNPLYHSLFKSASLPLIWSPFHLHGLVGQFSPSHSNSFPLRGFSAPFLPPFLPEGKPSWTNSRSHCHWPPCKSDGLVQFPSPR